MDVLRRLILSLPNIALGTFDALRACANEASAHPDTYQIQHVFHDRWSSLKKTLKLNVLVLDGNKGKPCAGTANLRRSRPGPST
jgi:hypothetical protein